MPNLVLRGTRYYKADAALRSGKLVAGMEVFLFHTPYNPHDSDAVAVYLLPGYIKLGHLSRQTAPKYALFVDRNQIESDIEFHPGIIKSVKTTLISRDFFRLRVAYRNDRRRQN